jgi:hypothetical protein
MVIKAVGAACSQTMLVKEIVATPSEMPFERRCVGQISPR